MAKWIIDRTINLDYTKTKRVLELLMIEPRKEDADLERILMAENVLKKGSDGALRRRWYTYLRNYGLLEENELTEMGKLYANESFSLQELALMQLYKRKLVVGDQIKIRPFKILVLLLKKLVEKYGVDDAYISQEEFSNYIVDIKDDSDQEINRIFGIIEKNKSIEKSVVQGEHTDIWFNNIKQTGIFDAIGKGIFVKKERIALFELIADSFNMDKDSAFNKFDCSMVEKIEEFKSCDVTEEKVSHADNIVFDYLFAGFSLTKLAQKYYKSNDEDKIEQDLNALGIQVEKDNKGIYRSWIGYEGIVGVKLQKSENEACQSVGKLISQYAKSHRIVDDSIELNDDETLEERIMKQYNLMDLSAMESEIDDLYSEFQSKFSPTALLQVSDDLLPRYMFYSETKNQDNMCYYLEKNSKIVDYFGRAGIYSCYAFNLHFNDNHKQWVTGSGKKPVLLEYEEAIDKAKEIRQELIDACEIVSKYEGTEKIEDYSKMVVQINAKCSTLCNYQWFVKYLHMNFPKMFATFYSEEWQSFLLKKCKLPNHKTIYERSGELSLLAQRVNLPNSVLAKVLVALFGFPNDDENMIEEEENKEMVDRKPRTNKTNPLNSIIYGAPGTGKTYSTAEYAVAFVEGRKPKTNQMSETERTELMKKYRELTKNGQVVFTTFHQSYGYEDFIQGLRPDTKDGEMRFVPADGVFKKIADKAMQDQEKNYVIIIDEINRGNISKVFGELITLIEEDKRWGENNQLSVMLPSGQEFAVPNNLYIVGTMNSADKSIALIDTALRRRFEFIEVAPNEDLIKDATLKNVLVQLNAVLRKQLESSDLLIGHAYFIGKNKDDLANILNRNIIPLLYEYFYDNEKKVKDALAKAIEGTDVKINETINGRIRVE